MGDNESMVLTVAKAILAAHDHTKNDGAEGGWDSMTPDWQGTFMDLARAAILAMRDSTDEMVGASWDHTRTRTREEYMAASLATPESAHKVKTKQRWQAMIDAALKEE